MTVAPRAWGGTILAATAVAGLTVGSSPGGGAPASVTVTMPPMSAESGEEIMRDMGRQGFQAAGHYWLLGSTHYVYYTLDGVGWDPGDFGTALSGRTGIVVALTGGNRTAAQVATATASAIDAVSGLSATATDDDVAVTGAGSASAGPNAWDGDSVGVIGARYTSMVGMNDFGLAQTSAARLIPANMPTSPVIITGFRIAVAGTHTDQMTVALYQGGTSTTDPDGATLLGVVGVTTGSATATDLYVACSDPFEVDFSAGDVWVSWSCDAGTFSSPYPFDTGNPTQAAALAANANDYFVSGGNYIREMSSLTRSSDPADWPATLPATTGQSIAIPPIMVSYTERDDTHNNMVVVGRIGTRADAADYTGTSDNTLLVGNSHAGPATLGMTVLDAAVAYATHVSGSDYRLSLAVGGSADDNFSGAAFYDVGLADGTSTGWVTVTPAAGTVPIAASSRLWIMIHHTEGGGSVSELAFDPGAAPDIHSPAFSPAAYYNGNTSESEADDGTLGGTASTNVEFDEDQPQVSTDGDTVSPDGTNYTNDNNVGVRMRYQVLGFAVP